jgi:hypothetical protein
VQQIRIQSVVVPEIVLVVLACPVALHHKVQEPGHSVCNVCPECWSQRIEPRVDRAEHLVLGVGCKRLVGQQVRERLLERHKRVLH